MFQPKQAANLGSFGQIFGSGFRDKDRRRGCGILLPSSVRLLRPVVSQGRPYMEAERPVWETEDEAWIISDTKNLEMLES